MPRHLTNAALCINFADVNVIINQIFKVMEKTKFRHMASNLIATDVPTLIALQQEKLIGSFSYDLVQFKDTLFIRFFAHGYGKEDVIFTARIMDNKKGVDYNEKKKYREFLLNLQK